MSIVGIERDKAKENKRKQLMMKKIKDMQFVNELSIWRQGMDWDNQENYILLRAVECGENIGLIMWCTTARGQKLTDDVILVETNYTKIAGRNDLVRTLGNCNIHCEIALGGMYNLDKRLGILQVEEEDELTRAVRLAGIVRKYQNVTYNTDVDSHILNEVGKQVYGMVYDSVEQKARNACRQYYCAVINELSEDKNLETMELAQKWRNWDKNVEIENSSNREVS